MVCGTWLTRAFRHEAFSLKPPLVLRADPDSAEADDALDRAVLSVDRRGADPAGAPMGDRAVRGGSAPMAASKPTRVLIVDDSAVVRKLLGDALRKESRTSRSSAVRRIRSWRAT